MKIPFEIDTKTRVLTAFVSHLPDEAQEKAMREAREIAGRLSARIVELEVYKTPAPRAQTEAA